MSVMRRFCAEETGTTLAELVVALFVLGLFSAMTMMAVTGLDAASLSGTRLGRGAETAQLVATTINSYLESTVRPKQAQHAGGTVSWPQSNSDTPSWCPKSSNSSNNSSSQKPPKGQSTIAFHTTSSSSSFNEVCFVGYGPDNTNGDANVYLISCTGSSPSSYRVEIIDESTSSTDTTFYEAGVSCSFTPKSSAALPNYIETTITANPNKLSNASTTPSGGAPTTIEEIVQLWNLETTSNG